MVNDGLFLLLALMTLLLVMFLYAVITLSPEDAIRTEPPVLTLRAPPPASPVSRWPQTPAVPAAAAGQLSHTVGPAWDSDAPVPAPDGVHRPKVSGGPPWEPAPRPPSEPALRPPWEPPRPPWEPAPRSPSLQRQAANIAGPKASAPVTSSPAQRRPERAEADTTPTGSPWFRSTQPGARGHARGQPAPGHIRTASTRQ